MSWARTLISKLFKRFRRQTDAPPLALVPPAPDWLPEHQRAWQQFLASPAGVVLIQRGRAILHDTATRACGEVFHTQHSAGVAHGYAQCLNWLESLSRSSRAPDEDRPPQGQPDTTPRGELEFRESLSP